MEPTKIVRKSFSIADKLILLEKYDALPPGTKQEDAARRLGVKRPTLCKILKTRNEIERSGPSSSKRRRRGRSSEIESALELYVRESQERNLPLTGEMLKRKAEAFAGKLGHEDFKATNAWLERFRKRYEIDLMMEPQDEEDERIHPFALDNYHHWLDFVPRAEVGGEIDEDRILEEIRSRATRYGEDEDDGRCELEEEEAPPPKNKDIVAAAEVLDRVFKHRGNHRMAHLLNQEVQKVLLSNMKEITVHKVSKNT
eukprot:TRINITY_DN4760_c0_g1_i2.p1 TRINITY_DN4760_c0_g1~~TRINITY_DN4760_c0_g1_i2.p1  ORF type:complete len:256 (+),score=78.88 TRINITY_DN4760_c0_g1_i2:87-854(+)